MRNAKSQLRGTTCVTVTLDPNLPPGVFDVIYTKWSVMVTRGYSSNEDAEHTIGCSETRRPTLNQNMEYVPGKNLKLRPYYAHHKGAKRCKRSQTSTSQLDGGVG